HGAKERRDRAGMLTASTIEPSFNLHPSRCFFVTFGLPALQRPGQDTPTHFTTQRTECALKGPRLLGGWCSMDKLLNEAHAMGERARTRHHKGHKCCCQPHLGWRRMAHRGAPYQWNDGNSAVPPF